MICGDLFTHINDFFKFADRVCFLMNNSKEEISNNDYIQIWKDYGRLYKKI